MLLSKDGVTFDVETPSDVERLKKAGYVAVNANTAAEPARQPSDVQGKRKDGDAQALEEGER